MSVAMTTIQQIEDSSHDVPKTIACSKSIRPATPINGFCLILLKRANRMAEKQKELFAAIEAKDFEKAAELIQSGVDVNSHDEGGMSVLAAAAYRGSSDLVQLCIDKGANVNDKEHNQGYTPL
ncbi:ankyrin repeat protein, partial [Ostertagia ostertagi]